MRKGHGITAVYITLALIVAAAGCAGSTKPVYGPPSGGGDRARPAMAGEATPSSAPMKMSSPGGGAPESAGAEAMDSEARSESAPPSPAPRERPGLGTAWGERRYSQVRHVPFDRADQRTPTSELAVYYNDRSGARAMTRYSDYRSMTSSIFNADKLDVTVSLRDGNGSPLQALYANGRFYAVGEAGQRYTIMVKNRTGLRLEVVASVDGLDVLDGKAASPSKRGYLVPAYGSLEITGWRMSASQVAAFRLSSVRDSYAARTGPDRNVGVIGVAFFHERGTQPRYPWTDEEVRRRHDANPFPSRYATPPSPSPVRPIYQ